MIAAAKLQRPARARQRRDDAPIGYVLSPRGRELLEADEPIPYALTELAAGAVVVGPCPACGGYPGHQIGACVCTD